MLRAMIAGTATLLLLIIFVFMQTGTVSALLG